MRVAVLNRARDAFPGGDLVHIDELTKALAPLGIERVYQPSQTLTGDFDLFHIHHINFSWSAMNFEAVARFPHTPYIVTTIFYPTDQLGQSYDTMAKWLNGAADVIAYSRREELELRERTLYRGHVSHIPPGVGSEFWISKSPLNIGVEVFDLPGERQSKVVLTVAARAGDKNCGMVERICRRLDIPYEQAMGVSRADLPGYYRRAKVFVNASGHESFGLTILEALAAGCRVLATKKSWGLEWLPGIMPIDPDDEQAVELAIVCAYYAKDWNYMPNRYAIHMSWDNEAHQIARVYRAAL